MKRIAMLSIILLLAGIGMAQNNILITNAESGDLVAGVHFDYGSQSGVSDENGLIRLIYEEGDKLILSHVSMGKQFFSDQATKKALLNGELSLKPRVEMLQPAVVLAKANPNIIHSLNVTETDKVTHDAAAFLKQTPLVASIQKGGNYGFDPVLRGFKYDQINVVMDGGICATAACPNRMDPPSSQIPMNMVEQIEILKGPYALRYGTGFGGTINFKSQMGTYQEKSEVEGRFSAGYDGNGTIYKTEGNVGFSGSFYKVSIYGSYSEGNDYQDGNDSLIQAEFNRLNLGTRMAFKLNDKNELSLNVANNYASDVDFPALNMDLREDNTWLMNIAHKYRTSDGALKSLSTSVFGSFVDHEMDNLDKVLQARMVNAVTEAVTSTIGGRSEALLDFAGGNLFTGIDFKQQSAAGIRDRSFLMGPKKGITVEDNVWQDSRINDVSAFGEYHLDFEDSRLQASMRINYNNADALDVDDRFRSANDVFSSSQLNPSLSVGYSKDVAQDISLAAWIGRAQRSGSLTERYINFLPVGRDPFERVGNASLKPEVNNQLDLELKWQTASSNINVDVFASVLNNFISSEIKSDLTPLMPTAPGVKQYVNIDNALLSGAELSWTHQWTTTVYTNAALAYTYGENLVDNTALPEIAPLDARLNLGVNLFKNKLTPELAFRFVTEQNRISAAYGETETPGFNLVDLMLKYVPNANLRIKAGISNIFDTAYYEHLSRSVKGSSAYRIHAPGRSFYATISYNL